MSRYSIDGALNAEAIQTAQLDASSICEALQVDDQAEQAALCIIAGHTASTPELQQALWDRLDDDSLLARAATWALGQTQSEAFICERLSDAALDQREHAYGVLAHIAARETQSKKLEAFLVQCIDQELERVQSGKTGLGEHACRVLAILGSQHCEDGIKRVTSEDQYSDRFELQRLRKAISDGGKDLDSIKELTQDWQLIFQDDLASAPAEETAPAEAEQAEEASTPEAAADTAESAEGHPDEQAAAGDPEDPNAPPPVTPKPIDWEAFLASDEAAAVDEQAQQVISQMGPMLEQLSLQALGKNLCDLIGQELVVMVLQVLPQALPPEYMQAALSPQSLNGMQSLARYLSNQGIAEHGEELESGVRQIRGHIVQQVRASGSLHGSDYDEPVFDDAEQADTE